VIAHPQQQRIAANRITFVVLKDPFWGLAVPNQGVADDEHPVLPPKFHITVRRRKVVPVRLRMNGFPFQNIFRTDGVELRLDERSLGGFSAGALRFIECRADEKVVFEDFFEGGLGETIGGQENSHNSN
jgi:hypothetical protein